MQIRLAEGVEQSLRLLRFMGQIHQINSSRGGMPKSPVDEAEIDESGVVGGVQTDRVHHGGSEQALCLLSLEVITVGRSGPGTGPTW